MPTEGYAKKRAINRQHNLTNPETKERRLSLWERLACTQGSQRLGPDGSENNGSTTFFLLPILSDCFGPGASSSPSSDQLIPRKAEPNQKKDFDYDPKFILHHALRGSVKRANARRKYSMVIHYSEMPVMMHSIADNPVNQFHISFRSNKQIEGCGTQIATWIWKNCFLTRTTRLF